MHRSMCVLEKLYQWAINANRNNQEDSNDRRIFDAKAFALHSLPRKHRLYTLLHSKTLFTLYPGVPPEFC